MRKAGSILALIAGTLGLLISIVLLLLGEINVALELEGATRTIIPGGFGAVFSFLVVVAAILCISTTTREAGVLLIFVSLGGLVFGGWLLIILMAFSLIGGILATIDTQPK